MMRVKNVQTLLEEDIFRVKEKRYVTDYLSRDRNDLMSYEKGVGVFDGLCDFGQSLWNQYQNGEDIDLLEAVVVDFGAGTIGSLAEQIISGDGIDISDALYDGVMNTVEGLVFGKQSVKGLGDAIKRGAKAGAATSIVDNIHNAVTGGSGTGAGAGFGMLGLGINSGLSQIQSRDPKTACGSTNPFSSGINFNGSNGYQNWIANGSVNRTGNGFSLADTLGDIVNDTIWGGVGSAAQYGGGKLVEGLENFVSKRWNFENKSNDTPLLKYNLQFFGGTGKRPPNLSSEGAGRKGAFRGAKRSSNIPVTENPTKVTQAVDRRGNIIPGRDYYFNDGKIVREHYEHTFFDDPSQDRGPHFNDIWGNHFDY